MSKIAVVYWSGTGNTEAMANAVAEAAREAGAEVDLLTVSEFTGVDGYDAFAFGCPAMGAEELEDTEFLPMWEDVKASLAGKKVVLFGSYGWGDGEWMRAWTSDAEASGITLAAEAVIANEAPDEEALEALKALGQTIA